MEILTGILNSIKEDAPLQEVRRGIHWTAVVSKRCGLASTMIQGCSHNEEPGTKRNPFSEMTALELARYCTDDNIEMASVGLAAINSVLDIDSDRYSSIDGLQMVKDMCEGKNVSVIGHFPFSDEQTKKAKNLWIIEKRPKPGDYPEERGNDFIPQSDIVVISSTTLINHTLSGILKLCRKESVKMLLGPTTPLSETLFDYGIDVLAGSVVTQKEAVLRSVSEGDTFMELKKKGGIRFVSIIKDYADVHRRLSKS